MLGRDICTKWRAGSCTFHGCKFYHFGPGLLVTALPGLNPQCVGKANLNLKAERLIHTKLDYSQKQKDSYQELMDKVVATLKQDTRLKREAKAEKKRIAALMAAAQPSSSEDEAIDNLSPPEVHEHPPALEQKVTDRQLEG